jgi:hypothetical protein
MRLAAPAARAARPGHGATGGDWHCLPRPLTGTVTAAGQAASASDSESMTQREPEPLASQLGKLAGRDRDSLAALSLPGRECHGEGTGPLTPSGNWNPDSDNLTYHAPSLS